MDDDREALDRARREQEAAEQKWRKEVLAAMRDIAQGIHELANEVREIAHKRT